MSQRPVYLRPPDPMDTWLESQGYYRKPIVRDGSCLFRAVAEQLFYTQAAHTKVRMATVRYIARHREQYESFVEGRFDHYLYQMQKPREWGSHIEICAMSLLYKRDFCIFREAGKPPENATRNGFNRYIHLCYTCGSHYDSVFLRDHVYNSGMCQSIAYEILYKNVFKLEDAQETAQRMLADDFYFALQPPTNPIQDGPAERLISDSPSPDIIQEPPTLTIGDDSKTASSTPADPPAAEKSLEKAPAAEKEVKEKPPPFIQKPFSYKVAKALVPQVYRNIDLDVWRETKGAIDYQRHWNGHWRPRDSNHWTPASSTTSHSYSSDSPGNRNSVSNSLIVGEKCLYKVPASDTADGESSKEPVTYNVHIQEMAPNKGPVTVYIEELVEWRVVAFEDLTPIPRAEPKTYQPPFNHYKSLSGYYEKTSVHLPEYAGRGRKPRAAKAPRSKGREAVPFMAVSMGPTGMGMNNKAAGPATQPQDSYSGRGRGRGVGMGGSGARNGSYAGGTRFGAPNANQNTRMNQGSGATPVRRNSYTFKPEDQNAFPALPKVNGNSSTVPVTQAGAWNGRPAIIQSEGNSPASPVQPQPQGQSKGKPGQSNPSRNVKSPRSPSPKSDPKVATPSQPSGWGQLQGQVPSSQTPQQQISVESPPTSGYMTQSSPDDDRTSASKAIFMNASVAGESQFSSVASSVSPPVVYPTPPPAVTGMQMTPGLYQVPPPQQQQFQLPFGYNPFISGMYGPGPLVMQAPITGWLPPKSDGTPGEEVPGMKLVYLPYEQPYPQWSYPGGPIVYGSPMPGQDAMTGCSVSEVDDNSRVSSVTPSQEEPSEEESTTESVSGNLDYQDDMQVNALTQDMQQSLVLNDNNNCGYYPPHPSQQVPNSPPANPITGHMMPGLCYYSIPPPPIPAPQPLMSLPMAPPLQQMPQQQQQQQQQHQPQYEYEEGNQQGGRRYNRQPRSNGGGGNNGGGHVPPRFQKSSPASHYAQHRFQFEGLPLWQTVGGGGGGMGGGFRRGPGGGGPDQGYQVYHPQQPQEQHVYQQVTPPAIMNFQPQFMAAPMFPPGVAFPPQAMMAPAPPPDMTPGQPPPEGAMGGFPSPYITYAPQQQQWLPPTTAAGYVYSAPGSSGPTPPSTPSGGNHAA